MESYTERRYGWRFWSCFAIAVMIAILSAHFLREDFGSRGSAGIGPPIAKIADAKFSVYRKPARSLQWSPVEAGDAIYRRDAIRIGSKGFARIKFDPGSLGGKEIDLEENSFIVISDENPLGTEFLEGTALVRDEQGEQTLAKTSDGQVKSVPLPARLLAPASDDVLYTKSGEPREIELRWKGKIEQPLVHVELSFYRNFPKAHTTRLTIERGEAPPQDSELNLVKQSLDPGRYYWRLVDDKNSPLSRISRFTVATGFTALAKFPEGIVPTATKSKIRFLWSMPVAGTRDFDWQESGRHFIEVSPSSDFETLTKREEVALATGGAEIVGLEEGKYFWRFRSKFEDLVLYSAALAFSVEPKAQRIVSLLAPLGDLPTPGPDDQTSFRWKEDAGASSYRFELRAQKGDVLRTVEVESTETIVDSPPPGTYEWRVVAFALNNEEKKKVAESAWEKIRIAGKAVIALTTPEAGKQILFWKDPPAFTFQWTSETPADTSFVVRVGRDSEMRLGVQEATSKSKEVASARFSLKEDSYFWRVDAISAEGVLLGRSAVNGFRFAKYPELAAPKQVAERSKPVYDVFAEKKAPALTWEKMEGAEKYEVVIKKDNETVFRNLTAENHVELKAIHTGEFQWTVRAIDKAGRAGEFMEPSPLKIIYPKLPAPKGLRLRSSTKDKATEKK